MGAVRRRVAVCAAGLASAVGCGTLGESPPPVTPPVARAQDPARAAASSPVPAPPGNLAAGGGPLPNSSPPPDASDAPLPVNLATALRLANARPLDVQIAGKQVEAAVARYDRARLLWVPNVVVGPDYFYHSGPQQNFEGRIIPSNRGTFTAGVGPVAVFGFSDAVYAPLAARQELRARQADQQATVNDATLAVAEAYFNVQQARGDLAAALVAVKHAEELARKTASLVKGLAPPAEANRANAELGRRRQVAAAARERWRVASAELARLLRLDPAALVEPIEPPYLPVTVIDATVTVDGLIPIALTTRPELAGGQAVVQATLARLKQEKIRPLVPSLAIRGASTNPAGTLGYGVFGGGPNGTLGGFDGRFDIDMQLLWEFQSLGLGNRARVHERRAEHEAATLDLFRTQDRIAAEVATAFAAVRAAAERLNDAEPALREAIDLVNRTVEGLGQTRRVGDALVLVVRPQEAVAAVQAFAQAGTDFFAAVADYNRAQFRLYRALGHPAQCLAAAMPQAENPAQPAELPAVPGLKERGDESPAGKPDPVSVQPPVASPPSVRRVESPPAPAHDPKTPLPVDTLPRPAAPPRPPVVVSERGT